MRRRRRKKDENLGSLDSLLDTMTTVVGILLIILIVLQLDVQQAVERIVRKDTNAGPKVEQKDLDDRLAQIKAMQLKVAAVRAEREEARTAADALATQRQSRLAKLASLRASLDRTTKPKSTDELRQLETKLNAELGKLDQNLKQTAIRYRELRSLLAKTPKPTAAPPNDVTIPRPRPAPEGAVPFRYFCRGGVVYPLEEDKLTAIAKAAIDKSGSPKNDKNELDPKPIIAYFNKNSVGDKHFRLEAFENSGKMLQFRLHRKRGGGTPSAMLSNFNSLYRTDLRKLNRKTQYVMYLVWPDSFQTYSRARNYVDRQKIPAGWEPREEKTPWVTYLGWYRLHGRSAIEEAAAAKRAAAPKPPPDEVKKPPPPPKNVLD